jgi:tripeptidyl-peptidase-1
MPASSSGDWINVKVSVSKANELLGTKYEVFAHKQSGKKTIRCLSYSVPAELQKFVQAIHPTTS